MYRGESGGMEEKIIALAGIFIAAGLFLLERHRHYVLEQKIDQLVHELDCFLLNGESALEESLEEGRAENLRNQLAAVVKQARYQRERWEQREKSLNQFMENMAHQMKTSLTALQIRLDLAQAKASSSSVREEIAQAEAYSSSVQEEITQAKASSSSVQEELEECQKCMERLTGEVRRILECSQLADQKINMWLERCDVDKLIRGTVNALAPLWKKKEVDIVLELSDISGIPELYLDSYWFAQALENVVKNAIEHTPAGSSVTIKASDRIHSLVLEIMDEGPGIPEDEQPYLFERFHRGSYGKAGYGIGLSMARDILKAHHGSIAAGNRTGGGAWFCLEAPILEGKRPYEAVKKG